MKFCMWDLITSCFRRGWWPIRWKAALQKKTWQFWWTTSWTQASNAPLWQKETHQPTATSGRWLSSRWRDPSVISTDKIYLGCWGQYGAPQCKSPMDVLDQIQQGATTHKRLLGDWRFCHMRKYWESWDCSVSSERSHKNVWMFDGRE